MKSLCIVRNSLITNPKIYIFAQACSVCVGWSALGLSPEIASMEAVVMVLCMRGPARCWELVLGDTDARQWPEGKSFQSL